MDLVWLSGSGLPSAFPLFTPPHPTPRPLSRAGVKGNTGDAVVISFKGRTHDWLQEETFLFLNLDQWKPSIFISDSYFLNLRLGDMAYQVALRALVLSLFRSLFRNVKRSDWLLRLKKDFDWLANGKRFFFLNGCRCSADSNSFSLEC